jgi:hypothetical protein
MSNITTEAIIEKLRNIENTSNILDTWSLEENEHY